jgi:hypothetical protein
MPCDAPVMRTSRALPVRERREGLIPAAFGGIGGLTQTNGDGEINRSSNVIAPALQTPFGAIPVWLTVVCYK